MKRSLLILLIALAGCIEPIDVSDLNSPPDAGDLSVHDEDVTREDPDAATGARVVLLVGDGDDGRVEPLRSRLEERGHDPVVAVLETDLPPASADLVIVTHTITGDNFFPRLSLLWNGQDVPFLVLKIQAADELDIVETASFRKEITDHTDLLLLDESHPLSGGLSGETTIFTSPRVNYCFTGVLPGTKIAALAGQDLGCVASIWEVPAGTELDDGTTRTTPRAALALGDAGAIPSWTEAAWTLLDAAVDHLSQSAR